MTPSGLQRSRQRADAILKSAIELSTLRETLEHYKDLCASVYQYIGAEGGEVRFLDALSAASDGSPFDTENLLPYVAPEPNETFNRETLRERALRAQLERAKEEIQQQKSYQANYEHATQIERAEKDAEIQRLRIELTLAFRSAPKNTSSKGMK